MLQYFTQNVHLKKNYEAGRKHKKSQKPKKLDPSPTPTPKNKQQKLTGAQKLDLNDKDLKAAIINMLKELKEAMLTEVKEGVMTMSHQIENYQ